MPAAQEAALGASRDPRVVRAHDPDTAAIALHDHLATTANNISLAMGGKALFELEG